MFLNNCFITFAILMNLLKVKYEKTALIIIRINPRKYFIILLSDVEHIKHKTATDICGIIILKTVPSNT